MFLQHAGGWPDPLSRKFTREIGPDMPPPWSQGGGDQGGEGGSGARNQNMCRAIDETTWAACDSHLA
jgi:hypothetical protein